MPKRPIARPTRAFRAGTRRSRDHFLRVALARSWGHCACMDGEDELLTEAISTQLEIDHQYVRHCHEWDEATITRVRRCGRAAGRRLGWKVRTFQSDPDRRADRKIVVIVLVVESTDEDAKRVTERGDLLLAEMTKNMM